MNELFVWTEKYRPATVNECVLTNSLRDTFNGFVKERKIPNMILSGGPGQGKTTVAKALCNQLDCDYLMINASEESGIDTLRTKIKQYASAITLSDCRRIVILDEADYLNPQSTQPALRGFMEEFAANCGFILTCNFKNKIIEPLHSRCTVIDFRAGKKDKKEVLEQLFKRLCFILEAEKVPCDKKVLAEFIMKHYPDYRRIINELQRFATSAGEINEGILTNGRDLNINKLYAALKERNYDDIRTWVVESLDNDTNKIFRKIYDSLKNNMKPQSVPQAVLLVADYQFKSAFSVDPEICLLAFCTEIMVNCEFV